MSTERPPIKIGALVFEWKGGVYLAKWSGFEISAYRPFDGSTQWVWEICTAENRGDEPYNILEAQNNFGTAREALKDACDFVSRFAPVAADLARWIEQ